MCHPRLQPHAPEAATPAPRCLVGGARRGLARSALELLARVGTHRDAVRLGGGGHRHDAAHTRAASLPAVAHGDGLQASLRRRRRRGRPQQGRLRGGTAGGHGALRLRHGRHQGRLEPAAHLLRASRARRGQRAGCCTQMDPSRPVPHAGARTQTCACARACACACT